MYSRHLISEASRFCWKASIYFCWISLISRAWRLDSSLNSRALSNTSCKESISSANRATSSCRRRATASIWSARFSCWTAYFFATDTSTYLSATVRLTPANVVPFFLDLLFIVINLVEVQDGSSRRALHTACYANKVLFSAFLTRMPASCWANDVSISNNLTRVSAIDWDSSISFCFCFYDNLNRFSASARALLISCSFWMFSFEISSYLLCITLIGRRHNQK